MTSHAKTVILVAAADRGHFVWAEPLSKALKSLGVACELFTHESSAAWVNPDSFSAVVPVLGEGTALTRFAGCYKSAASQGDDDAEGARHVSSDGFAGFQKALSAGGFEAFPNMDELTAGAAGRAALAARLRRDDVIGCVWEAIWCHWVSDIIKAECATKLDGGSRPMIPNIGIFPTCIYVFRGAEKVPFFDFDGQCRLRDKPEDIAHPIRRSVGEGASVAYVMTAALRSGLAFPPGAACFGHLLADVTSALPPNSELDRWLSSDGGKAVTLVVLGSQSTLTALGEAATASLLHGCVAASPRVLVGGIELPVGDEVLNKAMAEGRLRSEQWIPQWQTLGHPNVRCFVSHCGANSTHEALARGVPIVPLPFFDDQWYIAKRLEEDVYFYPAPPLRKRDIRCGGEDAAARVERAVRLGMSVPESKLNELRDSVVQEDGANAIARVLLASSRSASVN